MAQLPPKIPTMTPNWPPAFPHQRIPQLVANLFIPANTAQSPPQPPPPSSASSCWVDEFLDFSSARRGSHRRSISDSIAYLEAPLLECRNLNSHHSTVAASIMHGNETSFDRLDDEQLMSMFSDDMTVTVPPTLSTSNPSTPSDQNSNNDEIKPCVQDQQQYNHQQHQPKNEPGEVDSSSNSDPHATQNSGGGGGGEAANGDTFLDPKRVKRILANRQSAQRSRVRKLQYISELERSVTSLQTEVSALSPRVAFLDHQRLILNIDNSALKQRIAALAQDKIFKDAHQDALKKEIERLRQIYHQQNLKMNNNNNNAPQPPSPLSSQKQQQQQQQQQQPPPSSDNMDCTDKEQLLN